MDLKVRAKLLDESLDILNGLWSGERFSYSGEHYHVQDMLLLPPPVQSPRIPIWVVGAWPRNKSMQRVLRWDGILPQKTDGTPMTPADIQAIKAFVDEHRTMQTPFDIALDAETPGNDRERAISIVRPWAKAGVTWWLESMWRDHITLDDIRTRIKQGPPR
jgi:hypothetical protein